MAENRINCEESRMRRLGTTLKLVAMSHRSYYAENKDIDQLGIFSTNHYYHEGEQSGWEWVDQQTQIVLAVPIAMSGSTDILRDKYNPASFAIRPNKNVEDNACYTDEVVVWIGSDETHFMTYGSLGYRLWKVLDIIAALRGLEPMVTRTEEYPEKYPDEDHEE